MTRASQSAQSNALPLSYGNICSREKAKGIRDETFPPHPLYFFYKDHITNAKFMSEKHNDQTMQRSFFLQSWKKRYMYISKENARRQKEGKIEKERGEDNISEWTGLIPSESI